MLVLNEEQKTAVNLKSQFNLVIAGAGTGKTTVIVSRILKLLHDDKVAPQKIALLTFSNKAASEMKSRIERTGVYLDYAGTFHSISLKLINEYNLLGYSPDILEGENKIEFFKESIWELELKSNYIKAFLDQIEKLKRNGLFYDEIVIDKSNSMEVFLKRSYELYEKALIRECKIDYEDMLLVLVRALKNNDDFKKEFRSKFKHILIDEYQDSSLLQLNLLREMLNVDNEVNIFAVGDDDQSIYGFRDAKVENLLHFNEYFKGASVTKLLSNYRSEKNIIGIANSLIRNNSFRYEKKLLNVSKTSGLIEQKTFLEQDDEDLFIVRKILEYINLGNSSLSIAILFRYKYQLKNIIPVFQEYNIEFNTSLTDEERLELDLDNHLNAVELMTYHASKGLEFETVFLPYLSSEIFLKQDSDIEEERRLFYVGITRAKRNLFLTNSTTVKRFHQVIYANKLPFLDEI